MSDEGDSKPVSLFKQQRQAAKGSKLQVPAHKEPKIEVRQEAPRMQEPARQEEKVKVQQGPAQRPKEDEDAISAKVDKYANFVDDVLRVKLASLIEEREEVVKDIEALEKLRSTVSLMQERGGGRMKTMVNVGCECYMQAEVPDTSSIMINVGLGFFVEMKLQEAVEFVDKRVELLQEKADRQGKEISEVHSQIEMVLKAIQEVLNIADPEVERRRMM
uniref:Uncharacterized protein n=1 Tax=Guillardia theta TaxID=55529 RepID=A0A7S4J974_GUITH|mmetsp:Transcript_14221/g.48720  ORF Transcript_14221/g.48720 Transcript_14221/m.48720 type:complete len:218 (+) Transcript_14221:34-687(+)